MKLRQKKALEGLHPVSERVEQIVMPGVDTRLCQVAFVDVTQAGMFVAPDGIQLVQKHDVRGSFIKIIPTVKASNRDSVDRKSIRSGLLEAGATAVLVDPVFVPDSIARSQTGTRSVSIRPEQYLKTWFQDNKVQSKLAEAALEEAMRSVGEAGL